MKSAVFVTVRTDSTRLPNKALKNLCGKPTIQWVIDRACLSHKSDTVVLCTTERSIDDQLCEIAQKSGICIHRGNTEDKLARWKSACEEHSIGFFVTADGDDLFCEPELIDLALDQMKDNLNVDFVKADGIVPGAFTYGIRSTALTKVCDIKDTSDTEMMWVYFTETGLFNVRQLQGVNPNYMREDIRMTLDYEEDFLFFKRVIEHFQEIGKNDFRLSDILKLVDMSPNIKDINFFRQNDWKENQTSKTKLIIKEKT